MNVVVLGDGVVGTCIAYALVSCGATVTLVGCGPGSGGASWRSFAWLNAAQEVPDSYHRLRLASLARYRHWDASDPALASAIHFCGALVWESGGAGVERLHGADAAEGVADTYRRLRSLGHDVRLVDAAAALRLEPALNRAALPESGILWSRDEGWVDLPVLVGLLKAQLEYVQPALPASIELGRSASVRLKDGTRIAGDALVVAAGARTRELFAAAGVDVPERSTTGAVLFTAPTAVQPRMLLRTPAGSIRPRPGGGLVVHTAAVEDRVRLDEGQSVAADSGSVTDSGSTANLVVAADSGFAVDPAVVDSALGRVSAMFRSIRSLEPSRVGLGIRPIPGDGFPIVGRVTGNCFLAFTHSGATLAPILGELLATEVSEGYESPLLAPYRLSRFG